MEDGPKEGNNAWRKKTGWRAETGRVGKMRGKAGSGEKDRGWLLTRGEDGERERERERVSEKREKEEKRWR